MNPVRLIILGARGRMGQALLACAKRHPDLTISAEIDLGDDLASVIHRCDVVIDFSFHEVTARAAAMCAAQQKPLVVGTTGHTPAEQIDIKNFQKTIPIVWSSNYSTGVNTLFWLVRRAAEVLGPGFDLEVLEMHHRTKKDAPSGTAVTLAEILASARKLQLDKVAKHGRHGLVGERTPTEIGLHAIRGGDVVGDHTVIFAGPGERVEITHKAGSRDTFAEGALRAARWVIGQPAGLYDMQHVLGLK